MAHVDRCPHRGLTVATAAPWLAELIVTAGSALRLGPPVAVIDLRTQAEIELVVARSLGCGFLQQAHRRRIAAAGEPRDRPTTDRLVAWARTSADAGRPVVTAPLLSALPSPVVAGTRHHVARSALTSLAGATIEGTVARLGGARPAPLSALARELPVAGLSIPIVAPPVVAGLVSRAAVAFVPRLPEPVLADPEPNLMAVMLAGAAPSYLASAGARALVLGFPAVVSIAVKAGNVAGTVQVGQGRIVVRNGVLPSAVAVIDGEQDFLVGRAAGDVLRTASGLRLRPS